MYIHNDGEKHMIRLILASHGSLASGMKSAVQMITGSDYGICCYDLDQYKDPQIIKSSIQKETSLHQDQQFIILTDLYGGSVNNALLELALSDNTVVATGMNLGMVLSILLDESSSPMGCVTHAIDSSSPMIQAWDSKRLKEIINTEEDSII